MTGPASVVIGIDLGTSAVKAGAYRADGTFITAATRSLHLTHPAPGRCEQDLDEFYEAAAAACQECRAAAGIPRSQVGAISVAGQMAGVGLVDAAHRPLAPYDSWLDTRCSDIVRDLMSSGADRISAIAGCPPTVSIGPKMAWWLRREPRLCSRAASFVTAAGYVSARAAGLPGSAAFIDPSYLHFTAVADGRQSSWHEELVTIVGVAPELLPRITEGNAIVGELTRAAAADFGLDPGTLITAGCGDTAASALGAGVTGTGQALDIAGTAAVLAICLPYYAPDIRDGMLITMRSALPGRWYALGYVSGAGQLIEWIGREIFGGHQAATPGYADLAKAAAQVAAGSDGALVSPHVSGQVTPPAPDMRGAFLGLTPGLSRGHLARATLEAIAYEYRRYTDAATRLCPGYPARTVAGTGGGSRSHVWNQIKSSILGLPYIPVTETDTGTRGAAMLALTALGGDPALLRPPDQGSTVLPDLVAHAAYGPWHERYLRWQERLAVGYQDEMAHTRSRETEGAS
jgi:xylulokinase